MLLLITITVIKFSCELNNWTVHLEKKNPGYTWLHWRPPPPLLLHLYHAGRTITHVMRYECMKCIIIIIILYDTFFRRVDRTRDSHPFHDNDDYYHHTGHWPVMWIDHFNLSRFFPLNCPNIYWRVSCPLPREGKQKTDRVCVYVLCT